MIDPEHRTNREAETSTLQQNDLSTGAKYYTGIDWASLFFRLLEKIHWILLTALVCAAATGIYVKTCVTPVYQATSKLYIAGSEATISLSDIQLGSSLATDYQEAFNIWHVHEMVDERLGLDYSYSKLSGMISVYSPSGSHILFINARSEDPEEAKLLADTYAAVVQDFIADKMELRRPQLIQVAQVPTSPVSPSIKSSIIKAFLLGGLISAAVIVLLYLLDDKIRTDEDVEKATGLATLGILMKQEYSQNNITHSKKEHASSEEHYAEIRRDLSLGYTGDESINTICSAVIFAGKTIKRIAVTSHEANDGKTYIAIRIARGMAERGKKTLIIDGDLRKTSITRQYRIEHTGSGLAHLLSGQCALEDAVYKTNIPNLYLLPAGEPIKTPLPLLTSPDFEQLMSLLAKEFDIVIVDTPPIGSVIDAAEIAKNCNGSILVLEYNRETKSALRYMQKIMEQTGTPIIGCVINKVDTKTISQKRYYSQYGRDYGYHARNAAVTKKKTKARAQRQKK